MKKTSVTRALFVAGMMAVAGGMAQADAIFYPDGTHVNLGENAVETGLADRVLAMSPRTAPSLTTLAALGVTADQSTVLAYNPAADDGVVVVSSDDTRILGAAPATRTTTVVTTTPVYVFPNIDWDRATVLSQPHPMMSHIRSFPGDTMDRSVAATFDSPTRAGEMSTMTDGRPNLVTDNPSPGEVAGTSPSLTSSTVVSVPPPAAPDTTTLGAGASTLGTPEGCGPSGTHCTYLPD